MHQDCWLSPDTRCPNLLDSCFALPDGPRCRCPAHLFRDEHWSEFLVLFFCPCDWHFFTVQRLCQSWLEVFLCYVPVPQLHLSIKSVNELQCHSVDVRVNCANIFFGRHFHAACIGQRATAGPAWVLLTVGGTHGHPLQLGRCIESLWMTMVRAMRFYMLHIPGWTSLKYGINWILIISVNNDVRPLKGFLTCRRNVYFPSCFFWDNSTY